jgi:hypothetical protein
MTVDTTSMKIVASRPLVAPSSRASWFSPWQMDAYAKYEEGVQWDLTYSPDGQRLLLSPDGTVSTARATSPAMGWVFGRSISSGP